MLDAGVIPKSTSPWSFPVVIIPKKNGSKRFCVDYRRLNKETIQDPFSLPRIDDILDRLAGSKVFSTLDLKSGYWQVKLSQDAIPKTAFSTPDGHYEFLVCPFGLKNAPAEFSRLMHQVLGGLSYVQIYLDDITVHSATIEDHLNHLQETFKRLKHAKLKINDKKCTWFSSKISILGHVVSRNGIEMDKAKIIAVQSMKQPRNVKQVQTFLGLAGYYRRFIRDFAKAAQPLYGLLKKDTVFYFDDKCVSAFEVLKQKMVAEPILRPPDFHRPFTLHTDASGIGLGAVLAQRDDNKQEYVVCYASRILKGPESHYTITELECLAVVWAVKNFRAYLHGTTFQIVTDHVALNWLMTLKDPATRLVRWAVYLQSYDFTILHRQVRIHNNADALSRPVLAIEEVTDLTEETLSREKTGDIYDDEPLLYYVKHRRMKDGLSKRTVNRVLKNAEHYQWENEMLFYRKTTTDDFLLKVPPKDRRESLIETAHVLGHFQTQTTYDRLKDQYYWLHMRDQVEKVIGKCRVCVRNNKAAPQYHPACSLEVSGVFDRVGMDLVLGLPPTAEGYVGILVITEYLTKYPYAVPIRSKSQDEIAGHLLHYITTFGPPKEILSDQGREFLNEVVQRLLDNTGVERRVTSPYHPQTNGLTERFNRTLIQSLKKHCENEPTEWHRWIPFVLMAYRTRVHSVTGFTPFQLLFGRPMNKFEDFSAQLDQTPIDKRAVEIKDLVEHKQQTALETIRGAQENQRENQTKRQHGNEFELPPGQKVTVKSLKIQGKLQNDYVGIYEVDGKTKNGNYWLKNGNGERLAQSFPLSRLKLVDNDVEMEEHFEIEEIRNHKKRNGQYQYLVKWKGYDEVSWEPESNFDSTESIEDYWASKHRTNYIKPLNMIWKTAFLFMVLSIAQPAQAIKIHDRFQYCEIGQNRVVWDIPESCRDGQPSATSASLFKADILNKKSNEVSGEGWYCQSKTMRVTTIKTLLGYNQDNRETPVQLRDLNGCQEKTVLRWSGPSDADETR